MKDPRDTRVCEQCGAEYARSKTRFLKRKCGMAQSQENERWQIR